MAEFFTSIYEYLTFGIWKQLEEFMVYIFFKLTIWTIELGILSAEIAGTYITELITGLDVAQPIVNAINALPDDIRALLTILNFPSAITIIVGAYATSIGLRVLRVWR